MSVTDLTSGETLSSLNDFFYRNFVDLFTQIILDHTSSERQLPYQLVQHLAEEMSDILDFKCSVLPTGSSAEGTCVPDYKDIPGQCRYDSDDDFMMCLDLNDILLASERSRVDFDNIGLNLKNMPTPSSSAEYIIPSYSPCHPGFCLIKFHNSYRDIRIVNQEYRLIVMDDTFNEIKMERNGPNRFLKAAVKELPIDGLQVGLVLVPSEVVVAFFIILEWTAITAKYGPQGGGLEFPMSSLLTFSLKGPSIETVVDVKLMEDSYMIDSVFVEEDSETEEFSKQYVDIVPAIALRGWPPIAAEWLTRSRLWPPQDLISSVIEKGFHVVPVSPRQNDFISEDSSHLWRISFSYAERLLMDAIPNKSWCKQTYRIFKFLIKQNLHEPKGLISSYFLKVLFLWTLEEMPPTTWTNQNIAEGVLVLLDLLILRLSQNYLPHYFIKDCNLIKNMNPDMRRTALNVICKVRKDPRLYGYRENVEPWDAKITGISIEDMLTWGEGDEVTQL